MRWWEHSDSAFDKVKFRFARTMIKSEEEYILYLEADRIALGRQKWDLKSALLDEIWKFERLLRKYEYILNCRPSSPMRYVLNLRFQRASAHLAFKIPPNTFGPGLSIANMGPIVVNPAARIGANCRLHFCTSIATAAGHSDNAPIIGNNVYIGPGAKLYGSIIIADDIAIGANSVVNRSFQEPGITIAGVPAKKVSNNGSKGLIIKGMHIMHDKK